MLLRFISDILFFFRKLAVWIIAVATVPLGILILFLNIFPDFTLNADLPFWAAFALVNFTAYYFLRKAILWTVSSVNFLFEEI